MDSLGHVRVFASDQARTFFDDRHLGAEAAIHLGELQTDVAAADHDEMPGDRVQLKDAGVIEQDDVIRPRNVGPGRSPADIDEYLRRAQAALADRHGIRRHETGVTTHQ
ncbi:hypothetical protein LTR94_031117, partial [Friedmanniomyces endolithicus]